MTIRVLELGSHNGASPIGGTRYRARPDRSAFTLIELVVCIAVGAIICGSAGRLLWNAASQRGDVSARAELADEGALALELMARYFREISQDDNCPPADDANFCPSGNTNITTGTTTQLRFGNNGFRYVAGSGMAEMTTDNAATWRPIVKDVSGLTLAFYERTGMELASPLNAAGRSAVRRVRITLDLARGTQSLKLQTSLFLRNFLNEVQSAP